ncbi:Ran binding protein zinc finger-like protein, partial [Dioscorea alata]
ILTRRLSTASSQPQEPDSKPHPASSSLSARLSFVFDHLDSLDREREAKDQALQRLRSWHQSHPPQPLVSTPDPPLEDKEKEESVADVFKRDVELVHPWPEWIELMERLAGQKYFELGTKPKDEEQFAKDVGIDLSGIRDETGYDFSRDWITVRNACMNFGRDRFDILRRMAHVGELDFRVATEIQCVVFSAKLLRKYTHIDEGDVCSSCSLRNTCGRGYILTRKEDEARTLDVIRILLTYGFDHVKGTVENKPLMKMKSVKTVVRKLLHEVVKLSAVPIDPNLPPPVIKKPPPKVKQPPPPPKKRVGRDDVEMKKGDWLCPKCDFMNFAKNTVCLQCDAKRPKRQLLPGEWECPKCNFLNYRRNMACFHCEHKRPPDEYTENQNQSMQSGPRTRLDRATRMSDVSNAWNFDFDDNESDGADVAAFEFGDSSKSREDSSLDGMQPGGIARGFDGDIREPSRTARSHDRRDTESSSRMGFDDFDDEEDDVDNYELDASSNNSTGEVSRRNFSEFEKTSDSEDLSDLDNYSSRSSRMKKNYKSASDDVGDYVESEDDLRNHPQWRSSHIADSRQKAGSRHDDLMSDIDDDIDDDFQSKQRNGRHGDIVGRKATGRRNNSDSEEELLLDSESEDDGNRRMRGNRGFSDRRGSSRSREFQSNDRMHGKRNSFGYGKRDTFSRGSGREQWNEDSRFHEDKESFRPRDSQRNGRVAPRNGYGGRRVEDGQFHKDREGFRPRDSGRNGRGAPRNGYGGRRVEDGQFHEDMEGFRPRDSRRNGRGAPRNGYGGRRVDEGFQRFDRHANGRGFGNRQHGRRNQFTDYSGDYDEKRAHRRVIER